MVRTFFVALTLAFGVGAEPSSQLPERPHGHVPGKVLALVYPDFGPGATLKRVDPITLERQGRGLELALGGGSATAFSPDRKTLALSTGLGIAGVELVDLHRMRSLGVVRLGTSGWVTHLFWQRGSIFVIVDGGRGREVVVIDAAARRVAEHHRVDGAILHAKPADERIVLLTGPRRGIGPLTLTIVRAEGTRSTSIPSVVGGTRPARQGGQVPAREEYPALVVDANGGQALVYARRTVVQISLNDMAVTQHALSESTSLLERFRNWFEPKAEAKLVEGYWRDGVWLGDGLFAVTGSDFSESQSGAGLTLVDTRDWSVRRVSSDATQAVVAGHALVSFDMFGSGGVMGHDFEGNKIFHLVPDAPVTWLQAVGDLVYAHIGAWNGLVVIDAVAGRTIAKTKSERVLTLVEG